MDLSFKARKGFLSVEVKGSATVEDDRVIIEVEIPGLVAKFVDEETIRNVLTERTQALLAESSARDVEKSV
jgi:hypothetical protein